MFAQRRGGLLHNQKIWVTRPLKTDPDINNIHKIAIIAPCERVGATKFLQLNLGFSSTEPKHDHKACLGLDFNEALKRDLGFSCKVAQFGGSGLPQVDTSGILHLWIGGCPFEEPLRQF